MTKQQLFSKLICVILAQLIWCNTALAANANLELYRTQKQYFSENRTVSEKANPYNNPNVFKNNDEVNKFINETSNDRFLFKFSEKTKEIEVYDKNKNNELVTLIPLSTKEDLQTYKPSRLKEKLALMSKNIYGASKNGVKHTVLNLPMEASVFYMALGSVSALYLFTNAAENPAALKIFNDQQTSAVGVTSLFMFLASQNATSNVAQLFIKNPNWHIMLPYLGMTVGSMVQNYTTSLLTDPNIKACMNEMFNLNLKAEDANQNPCDKAYEYFTLQKPWEFAPGLASMIVSTIAASTIQYAASTGTLALEKKITSQIIKNEVKRDLVKMSLVRFAGFMNPGAVPFMAATGVWLYLTKASNLAFFAALDHKIYNKVTFATKNLQESVSLPLVSTIKKTSHELFETIISQKNENWKIARTKKTCALNKNNDCSGMIELLDKFQNEMKVWRTSNITDITETHQSWQTYLGDLVARYLASKEFYSRFINEAKKYAIKDGTENLLERKYLFWGVKTEHTKYIDETFYTDPHLPESEQIIKVRVFIDRILELTKNFKPRYKNKSDTYLIPAIKNYFVGNQLNSYEEKLKAAQGLIEVKKWLYDQRLNRITEFQYIYMAINAEFKKLGPVDPKIHAGEGFISAVDRSQKLQDFYKNIDLKRDNSIFKFKKYETYSDVILENMICGPDLNKNELLIDKTWGFSAHFKSPKITNLTNTVKNSGSVCRNHIFTPLFQDPESKPFIAPFYLNKNKMVTYQSPFEYLKFNISPELYNTDFNLWWENQTQNQMTTAFSEFKNQYNTNIAKLLTRINQNQNSKWNVSETVANGLMVNIFQELRTYLLVLGEIHKDHSSKNHDNKNMNVKSEIDYLRLLSRGSYLDFELVLSATDKQSLKKSLENKIGFQIKMETYFAELNGLLKKLNVKTIDQKVVISGQLSNTDFDPIVEKIEKLNNQIASEFGVSPKEKSNKSFDEILKTSENQSHVAFSPLPVSLNENTQEVVVKLLEYIQGLAYEIKTYGMLINAVNFDHGKKSP